MGGGGGGGGGGVGKYSLIARINIALFDIFDN